MLRWKSKGNSKEKADKTPFNWSKRICVGSCAIKKKRRIKNIKDTIIALIYTDGNKLMVVDKNMKIRVITSNKEELHQWREKYCFTI